MISQLYIFQRMQESNNKGLTKLEITDHFSQIFQQEENGFCFQCDKKSRQWAETKHGIFLCLNCAANFKELGKVVQVKSVSLDLWTEAELGLLKTGGNKRFKEFLKKYELMEADPQIFMKSIAANYYAEMLMKEISGFPIPQEPTLENGKLQCKSNVSITEMSSDELLNTTKQKLNWLGGKTKEYGSKAYGVAHQKITSGELKQDAIKAGEKVSETAKEIWGFMQNQVKELSKKQENNKKGPKQPDHL